MAKTPPPWSIYDDTELKIGIKGFSRQIGSVHIATVIMPENAQLILDAVNNHDALIEALRRIRDFPHNRTACEQAMSQIAREALSAVGDVHNPK